MLQVHSCQTFSEEQYAASFQGHLGAVYRVQESPFVPDLLLTASEDWTIRLWSKYKVRSSFLLASQTASMEQFLDKQESPNLRDTT